MFVLCAVRHFRGVVSCSVRTSTIFALSSGSLPSAIAVIRISGKESHACLERLTKRGKFKARHMFYSPLFDAEGGLIDRAMAVFLPGPSTFTGEDTAEIYIHGSRAVVNCVCETLNRFEKVRPAKAGEFTKRAFFNSKLNLEEVQSLSYLLSAETQRQRVLAINSNQIGSAVNNVRESLLQLACTLEAGIDFTDDVSFDWNSFVSRVDDVISELKAIDRRAQRGSLITDGARVVMLGKTNVGKSSLLNRIAEREVAIVSDIEGTTRDAVEARIELASVPVIFTDTAGLRTANDFLEAEGISRTIARAAEAQVLLAVVDVSRCENLEAEVTALLRHCKREHAPSIVVACNKSDLLPSHTRYDVSSLPWKVIFTSCIDAAGIDKLLEAVEEEIGTLCPDEEDDAILSRYRQRLLLTDAISVLQQIPKTHDAALAAEYLREASDLIGEISGAIVNEEILERIFSSFCIGK
ncbi:tRNA modification GTPase GTPBP3, mitochondrial [Toxocara canis]|uniref:tRNA modification GTPase GTPBP3, mitochondrial n=2 Tax=Toxocara canis TaxID=6265 RepID=A0A0B2UN29_TOXCA|nr:tRNA modification GTPase GTPBP3, mitochondrial [Toxocara canis]VDM36913.1 unnamed protein product [Toxocara canis]